jgi:hypothetical protein
MLADEAAIVPNSGAKVTKAATFIKEGIRIQDGQYVLGPSRNTTLNIANRLKVRKLVARLKAHFTETMKKEINKQRAALENSIVS